MRTSTKKEEIYEYICVFISKHGYAPSVREICSATGLSSTSAVHHHLRALTEEGRIILDDSKRRPITLPSMSHQGKVPLVGVVAAGRPILAIENIEGYIPWDDEDCFALRVRGDSMIDIGILPGDKVIVRQQPSADNGDIVVAMLDDEATVKRLSISKNGVWLIPENENYDPIDGREATILGKVKGLVREF